MASQDDCPANLATAWPMQQHLPVSRQSACNTHLQSKLTKLTTLQLVNRRPLPPLRLARLPSLSLGPPNPTKNPHSKIRSPNLPRRTSPSQSVHLRLLSLRRPPLPSRHHLAQPPQTPSPHKTDRCRTHLPPNHQHNLLTNRHPHHLRHQQRIHQHHRNLISKNHSFHETQFWNHFSPPLNNQWSTDARQLL